MPLQSQDLVARPAMTLETHLESACYDLVAEIAQSHGKVQLKVTGASMLPVICPGDLITVQRCDPRKLQPGEVILFRRNGGLAAHRIVEVSEKAIVTRGDALPSNDAPISHGEVVGRIEFARRDGRPVYLHPSPLQQIVGGILRRSERCTRVFLRLSPGIRKFGIGNSVFGTANPIRF
jgi:signal peptidase I